MEYELLFCSELSIREWAIYVYDIFKKVMNVEVTYYEKEDYISICCECFTFWTHTDELIGMDVIEEDFAFEANVSMRIQILGSIYQRGQRGLELLFTMLNHIIESRTEDFLLIENGTQIVLKKQGEVIYTHIPKGYETDFPFALLGREIIVI